MVDFSDKTLIPLWMNLCVFSGDGSDGHSFDMSQIAEQVNVLRKEVAQLERDEQRLDRDRVFVDHYIRSVTKDLANER